jgi:hypothetical protein
MWQRHRNHGCFSCSVVLLSPAHHVVHHLASSRSFALPWPCWYVPTLLSLALSPVSDDDEDEEDEGEDDEEEDNEAIKAAEAASSAAAARGDFYAAAAADATVRLLLHCPALLISAAPKGQLLSAVT